MPDRTLARTGAGMNVGIIGTGPMGLALTRGLRRAGVAVRPCSPRAEPGEPGVDDLLRWASTVVLAVPFPVALALAKRTLASRGAGRTLVDVTNPAMTPAAPLPPGLSGGERIAEAAPDWRVAKAFNTVAASAFDRVARGAGPVSLPVASDHGSAVREVFHLAEALGLQPLDAGGIECSRHLESLAVLLRRIGSRNGRNGSPCTLISIRS